MTVAASFINNENVINLAKTNTCFKGKGTRFAGKCLLTRRIFKLIFLKTAEKHFAKSVKKKEVR